MATTIYVLKLEGGRYYVGKTENLMRRYQEHLNGEGAAWTRRYPPVSLINSIEGASPFDEDKVVKEYMAAHGIDMVRGGSYITDILTEAEKQTVQREIWSAQDKCTRCGSAEHWVATCHVQPPVRQVRPPMMTRPSLPVRQVPPMIMRAPPPSRGFQAFSGVGNRIQHVSTEKCFRCGRAGHFIGSCYASTDARGYELEDDDDDDDDD